MNLLTVWIGSSQTGIVGFTPVHARIWIMRSQNSLFLIDRQKGASDMFVSLFQKGLQEAYLMARPDYMSHQKPRHHQVSNPGLKLIVHLIVHYGCVIDKF